MLSPLSSEELAFIIQWGKDNEVKNAVEAFIMMREHLYGEAHWTLTLSKHKPNKGVANE